MCLGEELGPGNNFVVKVNASYQSRVAEYKNLRKIKQFAKEIMRNTKAIKALLIGRIMTECEKVSSSLNRSFANITSY